MPSGDPAAAGGGESGHASAAWVALDAYFRDTPYHVTAHHLDSYDHFVRHGIADAIRNMTAMDMIKDDPATGKRDALKVSMRLGALHLDKPTVADPDGTVRPLLPNEARLKDLTYASNLYADVLVDYAVDGKPLGETRRFPAQRIGVVPVMLHSCMCLLRGMPPDVLREMGECPNDRGGYFIVGGKEKIVMPQDAGVYNRMYVTRGAGGLLGVRKEEVALTGRILCLPPQGGGDVFPRTVTLVVRARDAPSRRGCVEVRMRGVGQGTMSVPLFVLFRAMGVESDRRILETVLGGAADRPESRAAVEFLRPSATDAAAAGVFTQRAAAAALAPHTQFGTPESLKAALVADLFPHVGSDLARKAMFLGHLVRQLAAVATGAAPVPPRDSLENKRVSLSGFILRDLFRDSYGLLRRWALDRLDSEYLYGPVKASGALTSLVNESNVRTLFPARIVTEGMMRSMRGRWGAEAEVRPGQAESGGGGAKAGVVQDLSRTSYMTYLAHVRRVNNPIPRGVKVAEPHKLLGSQWGVFCPIDSPDGPNIGLLKHVALLCAFTLGAPARERGRLLERLRGEGLLEDHVRAYAWRPAALAGRVRVLVDGDWAGVASDPPALVARVRELRDAGEAHPEVSVAWSVFGGEVRIATDAGRAVRPLVRLDPASREPALARFLRARPRGAPPPTWAELTRGRGAPLELVDVEEAATLLVALAPGDAAAHPLRGYTHCELHPATVFSAAAATYPFINHNNSAYNSLCLAQFKQAVGVYATSFNSRMDVSGLVLHHPQRPLVSTAFADRLDAAMAHGENLVVAVACCGGYNMEDAVVMNLDSVQRGAFNLTCFATVRLQEEGGGGGGGGGGADAGEGEGEAGADARVVFANPIALEAQGRPVEGVPFGRYDRIDAEGFPVPGAVVEEGDVLAGMALVRMVPAEEAAAAQQQRLEGGVPALEVAVEAPRAARSARRTQVYSDRSRPAGRGETGVVDRVFVYPREDDPSLRCCKVRLRQARAPELGDKVASRFGQKGVVGMLLPRADMPFCHGSGLVPDLLLNPNGFPKRMTVSHLLESVLAKAAAVGGRRYNCTTFESAGEVEHAASVLGAAGLHPLGEELVYDGRTGEMVRCSVLVSLNYYGRLKHMVADKINSRAGGAGAPVNAITRQPTKGRGQHGGLRVGEMEQHALLANGVASFVKESFMDRSDAHRVFVEADTGVPCAACDPARGAFATHDRGDVLDAGPRRAGAVAVPFCMQLLEHELAALGIDARLAPRAVAGDPYGEGGGEGDDGDPYGDPYGGEDGGGEDGGGEDGGGF